MSIEECIREIKEVKGISALENPSLFLSMAADYCGANRKDLLILQRCFDLKSSEYILSAINSQEESKYLNLLEMHLQDELGISQEWKILFIDGVCEALGLSSPYKKKEVNSTNLVEDGTSVRHEIYPNNKVRKLSSDYLFEREYVDFFAKTIAAGAFHFLAIREDGKVISKGDNRAGQCNVSTWSDIHRVAAGVFHSVGLKINGTVCSTKISSSNERFDVGQCNVETWKDIVDIGAGDAHTVGLRADGTVVAVGSNRAGQCDVKDWSNIIAISVKGALTLGLKADGTVVSTGVKGFQQGQTECWQNIVFISAGGTQSAGIKNDGLPIITNYVGEHYRGQCEIQKFDKLCTLSSNAYNTVGLRIDGTVISTTFLGEQRLNYGQCDVSEWTDMLAVSAGGTLTIGLKIDGTLVATGDNSHGQCDVSGCKLFYDPEEYIQKLHTKAKRETGRDIVSKQSSATDILTREDFKQVEQCQFTSAKEDTERRRILTQKIEDLENQYKKLGPFQILQKSKIKEEIIKLKRQIDEV